MKKNPSDLNPSELKTLPPASSVIWKASRNRNEVIKRALQGMQPELQKLCQIRDEQLKKARSGKTTPREVLTQLTKMGQENKGIQALLLISASNYLFKIESENQDPAGWEILLKLMVTAGEMDFSHPWLESERHLLEFLNSDDAEIKNQCLDAYALLSAGFKLNDFVKKSLPAFYEALSARLKGLEPNVEDLEGCARLSARLKAAAEEKRGISRQARAVRKFLAEGKPGAILASEYGRALNGPLWNFIKAADKSLDGLLALLLEAAKSSLPSPFNAEALLAALQSVKPEIPEYDMRLLREELSDIAEGRLAQADSQLLNNILPAMRGERAFDGNAFDSAFKSGLAKAFSYEFFGNLVIGKYRAAEERAEPTASAALAEEEPGESAAPAPGEPEAGSGSASAEMTEPETAPQPDQSGSAACGAGDSAEILESMEEDLSAAQDFLEQEPPSEDRGAPPDEPSSADQDSVPEEPLSSVQDFPQEEASSPDADLSKGEPKADDRPDAKEKEPEDAETEIGDPAATAGGAPRAGMEKTARAPFEGDGFAILENDLSAPPQPEEAQNIPESMTLEQACAVSRMELLEEERLAGEPADPLERKFLRMRRQGRTEHSGEPLKAAPRPSGARAAPAEKKSSDNAEDRRPQAPDWEERKKIFYDFIRRTESSDSCAAPEREERGEDFRRLLAGGELEALYYLSGNLGNLAAYPQWLVELLYLGGQYMPGMAETESRILELTSRAIEEAGSLSEGECLLLAAALIRPALISPRDPLGKVLSALADKLSRHGLSPFLGAVESFVKMAVPVDPELFTGQSEERLLESRLEALKADTEDFLYRMRHSTTKYQPASQVRLRFYDKNGIISAVLEDCLKGESRGLSTFLDSYKDDKALEKLIDSSAPRHHTRPIESKPREQLLKELRKALALCQAWRDYFKESSMPADRSYANEKFYQLFEGLPNDMSRLKESAEGAFLAARINVLASCGQKPLHSGSERPRLALKSWRMRMPSFKAGGGADALIKAAREKRYLDDYFAAASIVTHFAAGELAECDDYLARHPELKDLEPDMSAISPALSGLKGLSVENYRGLAEEAWTDLFNERVEKVKAEAASCEFRGALGVSQRAACQDKLDKIKQETKQSGAWAYGAGSLDEFLRDLAKKSERELERVHEEIHELEARPDLSPECRQRLALIKERHLADKMLNLARNEAANIRDHLEYGAPLAPEHADFDLKNSIGHSFYNALKKNNIKAEGGDAPQEWLEASRWLKDRVNNGRLGAPAVKAFARFMRWLGFALDERQQAEVVYSTPYPNYWRVISMRMEIAGPLPQWSVRKRRHTVAFSWSASPQDISQLLKASCMDNEDCKTIICFNPLDFDARQKLMRLCGQNKIAPVIIDSNLINFLAGFELSSRAEALFQIGLIGAGVIPYVDAGGAVPKEMFFGREDDISNLVREWGPCIVYGGRQLGKSAILQQIHNTERSGVKTLLHSMSNSESSLIDAIHYECREAGIVNPGSQKKNFSADIKKWLKDNEDSRLLVLMDECDRALDLDKENEFAEISLLRDLMNDTNRRFKVVLTGLHSVQRFSHITNQPFLHFGEPLCIGPLSPEDAFQLMTAPMSYLGVEFAHERLAQAALDHCGYQPKLIQIFCAELLKGIRSRRDTPFETIDEKGIQKIYGSNNLKKKIVECFDMTLNLDDRYLVIGYTLAINRYNKMDLKTLLEELKYYWPAAFGDESGASPAETLALQTLLHEMEGLGIVSRLDNQYMLRSPNVIDLLGGEDQILTKLDPYAKRPYKPATSLEDMRLEGFEAVTASQFNLLSEKSGVLHWICGNDALGLEKAEALLNKLAENENKYNPLLEVKLERLSGATEHDALQKLRKKYESLKGGMICYISAAEFPFVGKFMLLAKSWLERLRAGRKYVKIICIIDPVTLKDFISSGLDERFADSRIQLMPWSKDGLEQYYKESAKPGPGPEEILGKTQGWPKLVESRFSSEETSLSIADFWNGDPSVMRELTGFIADTMDGKLRKDILEEEASAMLEMLPEGLVKGAAEMMGWLSLLRSLFILRENGPLLQLDPIARDVILGKDN